eukprot:2325714-Rhodomonas_salina.1
MASLYYLRSCCARADMYCGTGESAVQLLVWGCRGTKESAVKVLIYALRYQGICCGRRTRRLSRASRLDSTRSVEREGERERKGGRGRGREQGREREKGREREREGEREGERGRARERENVTSLALTCERACLGTAGHAGLLLATKTRNIYPYQLGLWSYALAMCCLVLIWPICRYQVVKLHVNGESVLTVAASPQ